MANGIGSKLKRLLIIALAVLAITACALSGACINGDGEPQASYGNSEVSSDSEDTSKGEESSGGESGSGSEEGSGGDEQPDSGIVPPVQNGGNYNYD